MKVLIIAANRERFPDPVFPLGAAYIAHAVEESGFDVSVFDCCITNEPISELAALLDTGDFNVIGISLRNVDNNAFPKAENYLDWYMEIFRACRDNSKAVIVTGGSAFSIFPDLFMNELQPDYGIRGEGEYKFIELLKQIEDGTPPSEKLLHADTIRDLNFDSFPSRNGFNTSFYFEKGGCINIQTKRGCEYNCAYCTYPALEGHDYRMRTPSSLVDEIEYWTEQGITHYFFVDSVFNAPVDYAYSIVDEIIRRDLKIEWSGFFAPILKDKQFLMACLDSGLASVDLGTDAFSTETLKGHNKFFTVDDIFRSCEICHDLGVKFNHSLIFGGPNETEATLLETLINVDKTRPTSVIGFIGVRLYPGTPIIDQVAHGEVGIDPVFFVSEAVSETLLDTLQNYTSDKLNWIIPGLEKGTNTKFLNRLRKKGLKGQIWEYFDKFTTG
jgi:radical SAM superfamily enzyme YgiQ (UPF0313 family)